jgi:hypothetical protein
MVEGNDEGKDAPKEAFKRRAKPKSAAASSRQKTVASKATVASEDDLHDRVAALRDQAAVLAQSMEQLVEGRFTDARSLARSASRQAVVAARAVRDDPFAAIVALGIVALVAALVVGRERDR